MSPGFTAELAHAAEDAGMPLLPGAMTPTDVINAMTHGFRQLKFFPAQPAGGAVMLRALHGPFPDVSFCPAGGISAATARQFLALPNVACVGGSWLTPKVLMERGDWAAMGLLAREAVALVAA